MSDLPGYKPSQKESSRRPLTDEERRLLMKKRIKELRRRKRRTQRRAAVYSRHLLKITLLLAIFLLCLFSSIFTLYGGGNSPNDSYVCATINASNQEEIEALAVSPGQISQPVITASSACLFDPEMNDFLYEKDADRPLPMASTTKIMTSIVVMDNTSTQDSVIVSDNAAAVGESSAWLEKGETLTVEQLLYALLVQSGNDAAMALAEHVAGTEDSFVEMMNETARDLNLENTHFANPHGLDQEGHYSSARDLALVTSHAMQNHLFREIVKSSGYQIPWAGHPYPRVLENHNKLLKMYPSATGVKTGYTLNAGKCLVASALKDGCELISVVLGGDESYWDQTIQLFEYGFNSFAKAEFAYSGQSMAEVGVGDFPRQNIDAVPAENLSFTVRRDNLRDFESATLYYREWIPYPVSEGQEVGYLVAAEGSDHEKSADLVSDSNRSPPNILVRFFAFIAAVFGLWWKGIKWLIPGL
jgi:D-alanyl-D-alanine carboxypeptidase (penicillin-binding protein 5/6)